MRLETLDDYHGQSTWRITTDTATYLYHRTGGGFASILDPDGKDWVSYKPGHGSGGEYRGIPNSIFPAGGFHPGNPDCASELIETNEKRVVIESRKGAPHPDWRCTWTITETAAAMHMDKVGGPYWMLYEGTPGGDYDEAAAFWEDSAGTRHPCADTWEGRLPSPRSATFAAPGSPYRLRLTDDTERPGDVVDSYWSMEQNMTVLGFGRLLDSKSDRWMHLNETPCRLIVEMLRA